MNTQPHRTNGKFEVWESRDDKTGAVVKVSRITQPSGKVEWSAMCSKGGELAHAMLTEEFIHDNFADADEMLGYLHHEMADVYPLRRVRNGELVKITR